MLVICRLAMKMIGSMEDEEIIIEQEYIDEAKAQMAKDPALRPDVLSLRPGKEMVPAHEEAEDAL